MPFFHRDGIDIYYETHGSGPALLLGHGFGASSAMWQAQIGRLSRHHQLILWDMRGHGRTRDPDDPKAYSEEAIVGDMAALLDIVGTDTAIVGGLSLGGVMTLAFHRAYPQRCRALLLIDTGPGYKNDAAREAWSRTVDEKAEHYEREGLDYLKRDSAAAANAKHRSARGLAHAARGMLKRHGTHLIESLPTIRVPTLVLVGADDVRFLAAADTMAAKIPGATKVVLPHAGHMANLDQPEAFNEAIGAFVDGLES
jgi:pimeloyl-ACP methyl ester carboxylesterase